MEEGEQRYEVNLVVVFDSSRIYLSKGDKNSYSHIIPHRFKKARLCEKKQIIFLGQVRIIDVFKFL